MEEITYNGNLNLEFYQLNVFSAEDTQKIEGGEYPIILAQNGQFTKLFISAENMPKYSHWDALDSDREAQLELHGVGLPIVWESNEDGGIEPGIPHKVVE